MKRLFLTLSLAVVVSLVLGACGLREQLRVAPTETPTAAPTATSTAAPTATPTVRPTEEATATPTAPGPATWDCPTGDQRISLWHSWQGESLIAIEDVFKSYMAACPNVIIELVNKTDLSNALTAAVPAGEGPDIFAWVNNQIGRLAEDKVIIPLSPLVDRAEFASTFTPTTLAAVTYNDELYGFPESTEAITMIYNRALISEEELPKTTDELLAMAQAWDKTPYFFVYNARNDAYFSAPWWQAAGVTIIDEEGNSTFSSEEGYAAGRFIRALRENDVIPEEIDYGIADVLFRQGEAAIIVNGPWYVQDLDASGIDYGLAVLPVLSASNTPGMPFVDVKVLMLTQNAEDRGVAEAAVDVLRYYTSLEAQVYLARANRMAPANQAAVADPGVQALPWVSGFAAQAANGKPMPSTPYMSALWDPMARGIECIWTGDGTVEECVDKIPALIE